LPFVGSLTFHGFFSGPWNHGGKAGLSEPIVSLPSLSTFRLALAQPGIAAAEVVEWPVAVAATSSAAARARLATSAVRMVNLLCRILEAGRAYHTPGHHFTFNSERVDQAGYG
jgi:hypothetical protein